MMWSNPGITAITIPYFDTNDFYFSGHIASSTIYTLEYWSMGWKKVSMMVAFIVFNEYLLLLFVRVHYVIDTITGFIIAFHLHRLAEYLCFFWDVKLMGYPAHRRQMYYFAPCPRCGWSNESAEKYVDQGELLFQKDKFVKSGKQVTMSSSENYTSPREGSGEEALRNSNRQNNAEQPAAN